MTVESSMSELYEESLLGEALRRYCATLGLTVFAAGAFLGTCPSARSASDTIAAGSLMRAWTGDDSSSERPAPTHLPVQMDWYSVTTAAVPAAATTDQTSTSSQIRELYALSGLTWEQLARLFGVSRRAVHAWAAGQRVSAVNAERISHVLSAVRQLDAGSPDGRRALLFQPGQEGTSKYDTLRLAAGHKAAGEARVNLSVKLGLRKSEESGGSGRPPSAPAR